MRLAPTLDEARTWRHERWTVLGLAALGGIAILGAATGQPLVFAGWELWLLGGLLLIHAALTVGAFWRAGASWRCARCGRPWRKGDTGWMRVGPPWVSLCSDCDTPGHLLAAWQEKEGQGL